MQRQKSSSCYKLAILFLILVMVVPVLFGCDNGVSQKDYDAAVAEKAAVQSDLTSAQAKVSTLTSDLAAAKTALAKPQEPVLADPIKTDAGYVSGTVTGELGNDVHIYKGIPYAAPPVGDLRWKPPQPVVPWSGIRESTVYSVQAAQQVSPVLVAALGEAPPSSEDCLYLNVVTPAKKTTDRFPVMVWFHGGGYFMGTSNSTTSNNHALPQHGVVIVEVNQRLGVFGLLAHPLLDKESPNGVSGNYMFLDQIAALKWVQKNIAAFGGDPGNVTIFGQSGGSAKTVNMMASPLAKGLFNKAICHSGMAGGTPLKNVEAMGTTLFAKFGVDKEKDPLVAARALPWEKIIEIDGENSSSWGLAVDGWFMPDTPANIFQAGKQNVVPFIAGACMGELTGPGPVMMPQVIPAYVGLFAGASKVNSKAYAYVFTHVPSKWKQDGMVAYHTLDLLYVFGSWNDTYTTTAHYKTLAQPSGAKQPDPGMTDVDAKLSEAMMTMWAQFAKTGDPNVAGLVTWPAYEAAADKYLDIGDTLQVKSGFSNVVPPPAAKKVCPSVVSPSGEIHTGFDINSTIEDLMCNPDTLKVLQKWIPTVITAPSFTLAKAYTLGFLAPIKPDVFTAEIMAGIEKDLAAIK